jgi:acetylornithine deacetylase
MVSAKSYVRESSTLDLLKSLVRINSVNPVLVPGAPGEAEAAEFVAAFMDHIGFKTSIDEIAPGRPNVIGILRGSGKGSSLMLNGHLDTVGLSEMQIDPLDPVIKDGLLYGRGAFDMKGGLAAMLSAAEAIADSGVELAGDLVIGAVCDEEHMSIGTDRLVESTRTDSAIVVEPTALQAVIAHKGFAWIEVEFHGVAAHGSSPAEGVDAIMNAGRFLVALEEYQRTVLSNRSHPLVGSPSLHSSTINGGRELSTYPDYCRLQIERRLIPGESTGDVRNEIGALLASLSDSDPRFKADYRIVFMRGPMEASSESSICMALMKSIEIITGRPAQVAGVSYWLDSEIIWRNGIPVVVFGPAGGGAHAATEYVSTSSVIDVARVLEGTIARYCGSRRRG